MAMGRPTKYKVAFVKAAEKLCKLGATERDVAEAFEVDIATITRWKVKYPDFCTALKVGKAPADDRVEQSLYRKATGYSFEAEKIFQYEGKPVRVSYVEHVPPSDTACIFWLKNRRPGQWRDKPESEGAADDLAATLAKLIESRPS